MTFELSNFLELSLYKPKKPDYILDVGAGGGDYVLEFKSAGLNAVGVDPFLQENIGSFGDFGSS